MLLKKLARYSRAAGLLVACLAAAAILITAYQPGQPTDIAMPELQPEAAAEVTLAAAAAVEPIAAIVRPETPKPEPAPAAAPAVKKAAPKAPAAAPRSAAAKPAAAKATAAKATVAEPAPKAAVAVEPAVKAPAPAMEPAPKAAAAAVAVNASAQDSDIVTLTGCLERDKRNFRLKDTSGMEAPKARSWKSGFLKKGSATIDVVDAANRLKLTDHVGERVSVTGRLVDREMSARSLQRIGASCD